MQRDCPNEEDIACFVEGRLPEGERREIEEHLEGCSWCREIILVTEAVYRNEKNDGLKDVPKDLLERVRALIREKVSLN